jgi:EamA-like transporter family
MTDNVSASAWIKGITFSVLASIIGGASKLAIRKSWLIEANATQYLLAETTADEEETDRREEMGSQQELAPYLQLSPNPSYDGDDVIDEAIRHRSKGAKRVAYSLRLMGMIGMTFLNPLCCVIAMNYASPSILAPFSGLTLVWIVLFSETLIGEIPRRPQVVAAGLVVIGEVVVAAFGDHKNDENVNLEQLVSHAMYLH